MTSSTDAQVTTIATLQALVDALKEARRAIGDHIVPEHCYATGPATGDAFRDLVQCPACAFLAVYDAAIADGNAAIAQLQAASEVQPAPIRMLTLDEIDALADSIFLSIAEQPADSEDRQALRQFARNSITLFAAANNLTVKD